MRRMDGVIVLSREGSVLHRCRESQHRSLASITPSINSILNTYFHRYAIGQNGRVELRVPDTECATAWTDTP